MIETAYHYNKIMEFLIKNNKKKHPRGYYNCRATNFNYNAQKRIEKGF